MKLDTTAKLVSVEGDQAEYHGPAIILLDRAVVVVVEVHRQGRVQTVSMPSPSEE